MNKVQNVLGGLAIFFASLSSCTSDQVNQKDEEDPEQEELERIAAEFGHISGEYKEASDAVILLSRLNRNYRQERQLVKKDVPPRLVGSKGCYVQGGSYDYTEEKGLESVEDSRAIYASIMQREIDTAETKFIEMPKKLQDVVLESMGYVAQNRMV